MAMDAAHVFFLWLVFCGMVFGMALSFLVVGMFIGRFFCAGMIVIMFELFFQTTAVAGGEFNSCDEVKRNVVIRRLDSFGIAGPWMRGEINGSVACRKRKITE